MAWSKATKGAYLVASETITLSQGQTATSYTSVIDFIPPGKSWVVGTYPSANLSSTGVDIDVYAAVDSGGTFGLLKADLATVDAQVMKFVTYSTSYGEAPCYKLAIVPDAAQKASNIKVFIVVAP